MSGRLWAASALGYSLFRLVCGRKPRPERRHRLPGNFRPVCGTSASKKRSVVRRACCRLAARFPCFVLRAKFPAQKSGADFSGFSGAFLGFFWGERTVAAALRRNYCVSPAHLRQTPARKAEPTSQEFPARSRDFRRKKAASRGPRLHGQSLFTLQVCGQKPNEMARLAFRVFPGFSGALANLPEKAVGCSPYLGRNYSGSFALLAGKKLVRREYRLCWIFRRKSRPEKRSRLSETPGLLVGLPPQKSGRSSATIQFAPG